MSSFPRRSGVTSRMRLRGHDYSDPGLYFLTACVNDWTQRFGQVIDDVFVPNSAGRMVAEIWETMPNRFANASLDAWCIMPNHFHAIVGIGLHDTDVPPYPSISSIMNWFKSASTVQYIRGVKSCGWPSYEKHLWLEGFYDHLIRDELDLERIRTYIDSNAANWHRDSLFQAK